MKRVLSAIDFTMVLLFALPVLASAVGGASAVKIVFPALAFILALRTAQREPARYVQLVLWTIILSPGERHFVDWYAGFSQSNPIMTAPYLVILAASPAVTLYLLSARRYAVEFLLIIGLVTVATWIPMSRGALSDPLMGALHWLMPLWLAIYLCARAENLPETRRAALRTFRLAVPVIAFYGLDQFVDIQGWDKFFMDWAPINSIGYPVPFEVRVFATMNSPGSLAAMLSTGILLLLPTTNRTLRWAGILLGVGCLFMTTQRAALGGLVAGIITMVAVGRDPAVRRGIVKMAVTVAVVCAVALSVPGAAKKLMSTVDSVSQLDQDGSAQERLIEYADSVATLDDHKLGFGMGWTSDPDLVNRSNVLPLDSGVLDIFFTLGLVGGTLFIATIGILCVQGLRICRGQSGAAAELAGAIYGLAQLPFGSQHTAEHGMFLYLSLGLLLARGVAVQAPRRRRVRNPLIRDRLVQQGPVEGIPVRRQRAEDLA